MDDDDYEYLTIEGPVESYDDRLALRVPLEAGGERLASRLREIGMAGEGYLASVDDGRVVIVIEPRVAERLKITLGSRVVVDDFNDKLNITRSGELVSIEGPIELHGDQLALLIPLDAGGSKLAPLAARIGTVEDGRLIVVIAPRLAEKMNVSLGSLVVVHNRNGLFNLTRSGWNDV